MTTPMYLAYEEPVKRVLAACVAVVLVATFVGCGGGSASSSTNTPSPFSATYLTVSLTTGVYSPSTTRLAPLTTGTVTTKALSDPADTIVFKRLTNGSYLATTEVTRYQWTLVMGTTPWVGVSSSIQGSSSDTQLPASNISRDDATAFAAAVATRCSLAAKVPTVPDFQDAFGGAGHDYPWSGALTATTVATLRESGTTGPTAVGTYVEINGFYDLVGNVREWTLDGHLVGGGWLDNAAVAKLSKAMLTVDPDIRHPLSGVRLIINN